ncbi:hypothetical protein M4D49_27255 [Cupriavidus pauculus]|uniref:hypothetical protein n=1 Tax=Burkholderiaceae TaxID=119060 RepID=UPI00203E4DA6|nr:MULTISPECIES: hypothetical protein [Burkholderiaceae]MCM3609187.1 hypothetical protein [Cupriavidus pauculus]
MLPHHLRLTMMRIYNTTKVIVTIRNKNISEQPPMKEGALLRFMEGWRGTLRAAR